MRHHKLILPIQSAFLAVGVIFSLLLSFPSRAFALGQDRDASSQVSVLNSETQAVITNPDSANDTVTHHSTGLYSVAFTTQNALAAPTLLSPLAGFRTNNTTPIFSWNSATGATGYDIQIDDTSTFTVPFGQANSTPLVETSYTATPLPSKSYYWRVRARNINNEPGAWSTSRSINIDTIAPLAPVLSVPANTASIRGTPTFSWNAVTGATKYQFEYDNDPDFSSPPYTSSELSSLSHTPSEMALGTYSWHVRARDAAGNWSTWSASRVVTIKLAIPVAPALISPANGVTLTTARPTFQWNSVLLGTTYQLQVDNQSTFVSPEFNSISTETSVDSNYLLNATYYWRVRAYNANNEQGAWSTVRSVKIQAPQDTSAPSNPTGLSSSTHTANESSTVNQITVNWTGDAADGTGSGLAGFSISWDQSATSTPDKTLDYSAHVLSTTSTALGDGAWYFHLRTCDLVGLCSAAIHAGPFVIDTTAPMSISTLTAISGTVTGQVILQWQSVGDDGIVGTAKDYFVRYSTSGAIDSLEKWENAAPITIGVPTPKSAGQSESMSVNGLALSSTYYFAIRAQDEILNLSGLSNSASIMPAVPIPVTDISSLIASINQANANGPEVDIINLANDTYTILSSYDGSNAFPIITSAVTIYGNGSTLQRDSTTPAFRMFNVANTGSLKLIDLTIKKRAADIEKGGGIYSDGNLDVDHADFIENSASSGGAIFSSGNLTINSSSFMRNTGGGRERSMLPAERSASAPQLYLKMWLVMEQVFIRLLPQRLQVQRSIIIVEAAAVVGPHIDFSSYESAPIATCPVAETYISGVGEGPASLAVPINEALNLSPRVYGTGDFNQNVHWSVLSGNGMISSGLDGSVLFDAPSTPQVSTLRLMSDVNPSNIVDFDVATVELGPFAIDPHSPVRLLADGTVKVFAVLQINGAVEVQFPVVWSLTGPGSLTSSQTRSYSRFEQLSIVYQAAAVSNIPVSLRASLRDFPEYYVDIPIQTVDQEPVSCADVSNILLADDPQGNALYMVSMGGIQANWPLVSEVDFLAPFDHIPDEAFSIKVRTEVKSTAVDPISSVNITFGTDHGTYGPYPMSLDSGNGFDGSWKWQGSIPDSICYSYYAKIDITNAAHTSTLTVMPR